MMMNKVKILFTISLCISLAGCATASKKPNELGKGVHEAHLKGLNDQEALALFSRIYEYPVNTQIDETAKNITITAFMSALDYRCSKTIVDSGAMEKPYRKVELDKWTENDLLNYYNSLYEERIKKDTGPEVVNEVRDVDGKIYWTFRDVSEEGKEKVKEDDTLEIIQLTALYSVDGERKRRDSIRGAWATTGSVVATGVNVATRVAMMLAKFLLI
jgi:hypothetical protein